MSMAFKITIEETKIVTKTVGEEWKVVGQEVPDAEQIERITRSAQGKPFTIGGLDKYGYTPKIEKQVEVSVTVLEQTVEQLDLKNVIRAVNGIE
jgi:hypothetical protein